MRGARLQCHVYIVALTPFTVDSSGMDATAAVIAHEEMSAADPAFCLSYLAHSMLFVNNLVRTGSALAAYCMTPS